MIVSSKVAFIVFFIQFCIIVYLFNENINISNNNNIIEKINKRIHVNSINQQPQQPPQQQPQQQAHQAEHLAEAEGVAVTIMMHEPNWFQYRYIYIYVYIYVHSL